MYNNYLIHNTYLKIINLLKKTEEKHFLNLKMNYQELLLRSFLFKKKKCSIFIFAIISNKTLHIYISKNFKFE